MSSFPKAAAVAVAVAALAALLPPLLLLATPPSGPVGLCPDSIPHSNPFSSSAAAGTGAAGAAAPADAVIVETERLGTVRAEPCRSFSESYREARDKFLRAAEGAGAEVTSIEVTSRGGEPYYTDVAVLRGSAESSSSSSSSSDGRRRGGLVVHTSGVHGVEGYAGSAVQVAALRHLSSLDSWVKLGSATLVFVHAVNPFGMVAFRRTNENNVDLNRNALDEAGWAEVLARDPNIVGYDDFDRTLFNPRRPPTQLDALVMFWIKAVYSIVRNGYVNMKRGMVAAQYHNPGGISYGGRQLEASHRRLRDFLVEGGFTKTEGPVTWIDVHTGLGPRGLDTLLVHSAGEEEDPAEHFRDAPLPILRGVSKNEDGGKKINVASGYDLTRGLMEDLYAGLFTASRRAPVIATQEFGTVNSVLVARALILENMAYHHAAPGEHARWAEYTRDAFYVRSDDWRRSILKRGLVVLSQAVSRSSA